MNRLLVCLLAVVLTAVALPAAAGAVTIREFPIEPGAAPGAQAPYYLKAGPDGNLWIVNRGSSGGIQRIATSGQRLAPIASENPQDIVVGPAAPSTGRSRSARTDAAGSRGSLRAAPCSGGGAWRIPTRSR